MDDATALFLAFFIGLAAPLVPLAAVVARQSIADWKDLVLVTALVASLSYVTWPAYLALIGMVTPLVASEAEQVPVPFVFAGFGAWLIAEFCLAGCLVAYSKHRR